MRLTRRTVLSGVAGVGVAAVPGCTGRSDSASGDVVVGPGGSLVFEPEALTVAVGDTVTWAFDSAGHNVSARPDDSELVRLPDGASPFSSYDPGGSAMSTEPVGETYDHRFTVPGSYQYVCVPHISAGMVGRVVVEG